MEKLILLLRSPYNYYLYDANIGMLHAISHDLYNYLQGGGKYDEVLNELSMLGTKGFLKDNPIEEIENPAVDDIEYHLEHGINKLVLQVTNKCNFKCSYCEFTQQEHLGMNVRNKAMSWDIAKRAIEFYADHSRDISDVSIAFYGGEPLLELSLIKKCIEYSLEVFAGKNLEFNMTVNGSLLNEENIKYLIDRKVKIMVSLDGPSEIHNKSRKFSSDGTGTFETVYNNLMVIKEKLPDYYRRLLFNSVINPLFDTNEVEKFFNKDEFAHSDVMFSPLTAILGYKKYYSKKYVEYMTYCKFLSMVNEVKPLENIPIATKNFTNDIKKYSDKLCGRKGLPIRIGHTGPCKPGVTKLFVDVNGDFFPCEKVGEYATKLKIGDIDNGFYISEVKRILNLTTLTKDECIKCWCLRLCNICAAYAVDESGLSREMIIRRCNGVKKSVEDLLLTIIAINEMQEKMCCQHRILSE